MANAVTVYSQNNIAVFAAGIQGAAGIGIPTGGVAGQLLSKVDATNYNAQWVASSALTSVGTLSALTVAGSSATLMAVGQNGATNPALLVDASTASSVSGVAIKSAATGVAPMVTATDAAANCPLTIQSKGSGILALNAGSGGSGTIQLQFNGSTRWAFTQTASTFSPLPSGAASHFIFTAPADTSVTASTERPSILWNCSATRQWATGALTLQREFRIQNPTYSAVAASTLTDSATFAVDGAPNAGTNATITRSSTIYSPGATVAAAVADSYGLNVAANSGATRNWAARFPGQLLHASPTPGIAAGTGAGTTPTIALAGTVEGGIITLTTGTTPTASAVVATITPANAFPNNCAVQLTPANAATAALTGAAVVFVTEGTANWKITAGSTALTAATAYKWHYHVKGY